MQKLSLEISWTTLWRIFLFSLMVVIMYAGRQILLGLFLAVVISSGIEIVIDFLERNGLPRTLGVILVFLVSLVAVIVLVYAVIPFIIADLNALFLSQGNGPTDGFWSSVLSLRTSQSASAIIEKLSSQFFANMGSPIGFFSQVLGSFGLAVAVIISSFYLSLTKDGVERFIKIVFPSEHRELALRLYERSRKKIGYWFRTQILSSLVMCLLVWGVLLLLGVKHAFLLGVLAGIFELVPFLGPILAGAVAVIAAAAQSSTLAIYTLITFLAVHKFEANILVPMFMKRSVGLHPVVVIIALLIGAETGGLLGIIISVPAAAVFQEVLEEWSSKRQATA